MDLQSLIAYTLLAIAVGYMVVKFVLPKSFFSSKKTKGKASGKSGKSCGQSDCGCH